MTVSGQSLHQDWSPSSYLQFGDARLRPALDLLARIPLVEEPRKVVDLGCGPGNLTPFLRRRFPQAEILGVDRSASMLARAREENAGASNISWIESDMVAWLEDQEPGRTQLIYSNAALHWLEGHERIFPALMRCLSSGGVLAAQMPLSWHQPSHRAMRDAVELLITQADRPPDEDHLLRTWLQRNRTPNVADPGCYHRLLSPFSRHLDVWSTEILHLLPAASRIDDPEDPRHQMTARSPILDWVFSTALQPLLQALDAEPEPLRQLLMDYDQRLQRAYPLLGSGEVLLPFRRLYLVAQRS